MEFKTLQGKSVAIVDEIKLPKIILSNLVDVSADYRIKYNNWLFDFFGGQLISSMSFGTILNHPSDNFLLMSRETFLFYEEAIQKRNTEAFKRALL